MAEPAHLDYIGQEEIDKAHGQIAVRNGAAERAVFRALWIHMNPLVIACYISEAIDAILVNKEPVGGTKGRALGTNHIARRGEYLGHARWLDTETISPVI